MFQTTVFSHYPRIGDRFEEQRLRRAIGRLDRGEITPADLAKVADSVTMEAISEQSDAGIDIITDGMIRWNDEITYLAGRAPNVEITGLLRYFDTNTFYRQPRITGPLTWPGPILAADHKFAQDFSSRPVKAILTGPLTLALHCQDDHYGSLEAHLAAWTDYLHEELKSLIAAKVKRIQINEPVLSRHADKFDLFAAAWKRLVEGIHGTPGLNLGLYIAFGSVAPILTKLYDLPLDELGLDLVTGREALETLRANPAPCVMALGLLDARNTKMEQPKDVLALLRTLRNALPPQRTLLCPSNGLEFLPRYRAYDKLKLLSKIAQEAKEELA